MAFCSVLLALCAPAAQQVFLDEDFASGTFPPTAWAEVNYAAEPGWVQGSGSALHDDSAVLSQSLLVAAPMDLAAASEVFLHLDFGQRFVQSRLLNSVEYTLDAGQSFHVLYSLSGLQSGGGQRLELDLSSLAGLSDVRLAFRYEGYKANEWWLEQVLVDDQAPNPAARWPHLPAFFIDIRSLDLDFEALAGSVPLWMSLNELDTETRLDSADGWANLGNRALVGETYVGSYALELGVAPSAIPPQLLSNAMILAVDGTGFEEADLVFWAKHFSEETHPDDGVFISQDGDVWFPLVSDWAQLSKGSSDWFRVAVALQSTPVEISQRFYLAFAQSDDFPFGNLDGVIIDEISFEERLSTMRYDVINLVAGEQAKLVVTGVERPGAIIQLLFSLTGPGPTRTVAGIADLSAPIKDLGAYVPDAEGKVVVPRFIPANAVGRTIWTQAVELTGPDAWWVPGLERVIQ